ncbi:helix-turn-helix domain-containing protein [Psychrobacter faecalis]
MRLTFRIYFETMGKICEALDVGMGELFTYILNEAVRRR